MVVSRGVLFEIVMGACVYFDFDSRLISLFLKAIIEILTFVVIVLEFFS